MTDNYVVSADVVDEAWDLLQYGTLHKSGRYPYGSGGDIEPSSGRTFLQTIDHLKSLGWSEAQIASAFSTKERPFTTSDLRAVKTTALAEQKLERIAQAEKLREKGYSNGAIAERMGLPNESSVRALLAPGAADRSNILAATSRMLRDEVEAKGVIDIGGGVENHLHISKTRLDAAIAVLKAEGYKMHHIKAPQVGTGKMTNYRVLAKPDVPWSSIVKDPSLIKTIVQSTEDKGRNWTGIDPPVTVDPKRVSVRYKEQGGADADGVIYVRPGLTDLSMGGKNYAQVRIAVGDTHYLKGMAIYKDDLPKGVDLEFNTNKSFTGSKLDAMKKISEDPDLPFGSIVRQLRGDDGRVNSAMNIVNEEGQWDKWSKNLSSQFLSKQQPQLAKQQLDVTFERRKAEFEKIKALTNPAVKKKLLEEFADGSDAAAVHLKAAAMPRQRTQVILPINSLKDNEVYAPNFKNGENVVLVRFPHGGTFEIPELKVNNRNPEGRKVMGTSTTDAIGINSKVAARLSGADFDGDTVLVIPNVGGQVKTMAPLRQLKDFDPQTLYKLPDSAPRMKPKTKGIQMGDVSNLITDMTIKGAPPDELARAVRHSMVVIDAEKHHLDYRRSARDHGILALKKKYQAREDGTAGGAATLISRKKRKVDVPEEKSGYRVNKATGERVFIQTGRQWTNKNGDLVIPKSKVGQLDRLTDAHKLSSGTKIEEIYADHSNRMKALANEARKEMVSTPSRNYSPTAKKAYAPEVDSLLRKLNTAEKNRPLERNAQILANDMIAKKKAANPDMSSDELKKVRVRALAEARRRTGAGKELIEITDREWDAIQAGAVSTNRLDKILRNTDVDKVRERATPKQEVLMSGGMTAQARALLSRGYTQAEVAEQLGVSLTTLKAGL